MLPIAGQTAGQNGLKFFVEFMDGSKNFRIFSTFFLLFFYLKTIYIFILYVFIFVILGFQCASRSSSIITIYISP